MLGHFNGAPSLLTTSSFKHEFLKQQDGYFIGVNITTVGNGVQFPSMPTQHEHGVSLVGHYMADQMYLLTT